jgi:hypothetical protein
LDKYLNVAEENKWKNGTIGYSNGEYKFISLDSMKSDIMKGSENINLAAWKSYVEWLGSFNDFSKIFGEDALDSVAIYISNMGFKSKLLVNKKFEDYIESYHSTRIIGKYYHTIDIWVAKLEDFTKTRLLVPDLKLPEGYKWWAINPFDLLKNATKGASPDKISEIKKAMEEDLAQVAKTAQSNKEKAVEKLKGYKNFTEAFWILGITVDKNIIKLTDEKISYNFSKNDAEILLRLIEKQETINKWKPQSNTIVQQNTIINDLKRVLVEQIKKDNATTSFTASKIVKASDLPKVFASQKAQTAIIKSAEVKTNQDNQVQNIQSQKSEISTDLLKKYDLPSNLELLIKPHNWNILISAISKLENNPARTEKENQLLTTLSDIKKLHVQKARSIVEMNGIINSDPSLKDVLESVKQNNDAFSSISKSDSQIYEHIWTFQDRENPNWSKTERLIDLPVWKTISFSNLTDNNLLTSSINVNWFIGWCSIEKTWITDCTIYFPDGSWISPVIGVPIKWVWSFMEQANSYSNLNCPAIIELIPFINSCISKKTGKNTDSFDGTFDLFESKRNIMAIAQILDIGYSPIEGIDTFTKNLKSKFPTTNTINSKLIESWILKPEWGFNKLKLEERINSINF